MMKQQRSLSEEPRAAGAVVDGLSRSRRVLVLVISSTSLFIVGLDVTAVSVALPSIGRDLSSSISGLQWAVAGYTVVLATLYMLGGSMGDRLGRKRIFLVGLATFSVGSLACSLASSVGLLVVFRIVQACGGSLLNPVAVAIITNTFTDPRERAQAIGVRGSVFGISLALGPVVGGTMVSVMGWRSIFLITVPIGIAAIFLAIRYIPESKAPQPRPFDPVGQGLVATLLGSLAYGIIEGPNHGWTSPATVIAFAASGAALVTLLGYEPRRPAPLVDLRFFRSIPFASAAAISVFAFAAFGGFLFLNTLYLQEVRGLSPLRTGLVLLPMSGMTMLASLVSGRIVAQRGYRAPLVISGTCYVIACAMLTRMAATTDYRWLASAYVIFGLGFGLVNAPVTDAAVSGMPRAQAGVASAIASTSRQIGQTIGVAVVGTILASRVSRSIPADLTAASHAVWWTLTGCGGLVLLLGLVATTTRATESARRVAHNLNPEALVVTPTRP